MKIKSIALFITASLLLLTACSGQGKKIDVAGLADSIYQNAVFEDQLATIDDTTIYAVYGLSADQVASCKVYTGTGATAEEIAVFEAKDSAQVTTIKEAVNKRIETKKADFESYIPKEMKKLQTPVIKTSGSYVIFCVSNDDEKAAQLIENALN